VSAEAVAIEINNKPAVINKRIMMLLDF